MSKDTASLYDTDSFKWSKEEYSLSDLVSKFSHRLPFAFIVTQGYSGKEDVGADEMYWLHEVVPQVRVVARDKNNDYLSIPLCYSEKVIPTSSRGQEGSLTTLEAMARNKAYKKFQFEPGTRHTIVQDTTELGVAELEPMEIINTYDERFLAVHTLLSTPALEPMDVYCPRKRRYIQEGVHPHFTLLPVYLPIGVAIALDVVEDAPETFQRTMYNFHTYASSQPHDYRKALSGVAEIMAYDQDPSVDNDYEYVHFRHFIKPKVPSQKPAPPSRRKLPDQGQHPGEWVPPVPPKLALGTKFGKQKGVHHLLKSASSVGKTPVKTTYRTQCSKTQDSSTEDSDSDYETIPDDKPYHNAIQTQIANRIGPLAMDLDPVRVLTDLSNLLKSGSVPASNGTSEVAMETKLHGFEELAEGASTSPNPTKPDTEQNTSNLGEEELGTLGIQKVKKSTFRRSKSNKEHFQLIAPPHTHKLPSAQKAQVTYNETSAFSTEEPSSTYKTPTSPPGNQVSKTLPSATANQPSSRETLTISSPIGMSVVTQGKCSDQIQGTRQFKPCVLSTEVTHSSKIPLNISDFTVGDVARCLQLLNMSDFVDKFLEEQIDGDYLSDLDEDILREELGLSPLNAKKLARFAKGWRPKF